MHKADVTPVLWEVLEELRTLPAHELISRIGTPANQRAMIVNGEHIAIDAKIDWSDAAQSAVRVEATAYGASTWRSERCQESILVPIHRK